MGPADVIVVTLVAVLLVLAVRSLLRPARGGCSGCSAGASCSARAQGGSCSAAERMLRRAREELGEG